MIKRVMTALYAHKSNIDEICKNISVNEAEHLIDICQWFKEEYNVSFDIVKYDKKSKNISFIESPNWNEENEPTVGISYTVKPDGSTSIRKGCEQIYHNKWQFVKPAYTGFDIEQAKERTKEWNSIPGINQVKSKIGYRKFWNQLLQDNGVEL